MNTPRRGFEVVDEPEAAPAQPDSKVALRMLAIGLSALSQRTLVGITKLFTLATVASAFWLWYQVPDPSNHELIRLGIYGAFIIAINVVVWRA